jgi:hypothetical protein
VARVPYSSGAMEGNVNKIKMIKRQMYGRAGFRESANASSCTLRNHHHKIRARARNTGQIQMRLTPAAAVF